MNAPNSSADRELESLRRAQRAHEPSMEEILASIRSIIADDKEAPAAKPVAPAGPQIVYSNDSPPPVRVVAPAPEAPSASLAPVEAPPVEVVAAAPKVVWEQPAPVPPAPVAPEPEPVEPEPEPVAARVEAAPPPPVEEEEAPFVSDITDAAVSASFNALSTTIALQSSEMIERLVREMLRPMLKTWLDDHLPSLVERLVRAEIQRVARGGR
jgi:cell pole-organizing protein PopZ